MTQFRLGLLMLRYMDDDRLMDLGVGWSCSCGRDGDYDMGDIFEHEGGGHELGMEVNGYKHFRRGSSL